MLLVNAGGNTGPLRTHLEADRPLQCSLLQNCWFPLWASESLQGGELDPGHRKCGFESSQNKWLGWSLWGVSFHPQSTKKLLTEGRESLGSEVQGFPDSYPAGREKAPTGYRRF